MKPRITILGAGESGIGAALLAQAQGYEVWVSDAGPIPKAAQKTLNEAGIAWEAAGHTASKVLAAEEIIKSPGIPPWVAMVQEAQSRGIRISSEIDFASRYTDAHLIAITGTNGKTTTTKLIYHLLKSAGRPVGMGGNVGNSFARLVLEDPQPTYVLEVSSFQLEDIHGFKPHIGVLLNITPDHLDRYNHSMEAYAAAKFHLLDHMDGGGTLVYNADDEIIARHLNQRQLTLNLEPFQEAFFEDGKLIIPAINFPGVFGEDYETQAPLVFEALPLRGKHNAMNMSAAILTCLRMGLTPEEIRTHLPTFGGQAHRMEEVARENNILYVNDSKATNVEAAYYALGSFQAPIVWIAGGVDKGNDYSALIPLVRQHVKGLICLGKDNSKLLSAFQEEVSFLHETEEMEEAVLKAYHLAEEGEVVLLAPACASFDLFKNYEDRGNQFKAAVEKHVVKQNRISGLK